MTCGGRPGSRGHEYQDAAQYAAWGVDYLKYDWCNVDTQDGRQAYTTMSLALRATGRPIVFSICEWGTNRPWLWPGAGKIANLWRTTGDIYDGWQGHKGLSSGVLNILDQQVGLEVYAGPGHWNDPDMLEVGNGGMTFEEQRAHFSLWAILAAPLIAGNGLSSMSPETLSILANREVVAVDQDPLGRQGSRVWKDGDLEVWARPLKGGARALVLLNRGKAAATITATWETIGLPEAFPATVRDLWTGKVTRKVRGSFSAEVASHGAVMVRIDS
jgi:alpha-galactosidase